VQIHEAISAIEHVETPTKLQEAREVFEEHLAKVSATDNETRGTYFYYLLRISLRNHVLFETDIDKHFYKELTDCFQMKEKEYKKMHKANPDNKVLKVQINTFYNLMERYFTTLEISYQQKNFQDAQRRAYLEKMQYRKSSFLFFKKYIHYFLYKLWELSSLYSSSFFRWGMSCVVAIAVYAGIFSLIGGLSHSSLDLEWYDAVHFSIATFTTLGFGDVFPVTMLSKIISDIEVFNGYLMLGAFMALIQKKAL
jgi:hypothetical protein